MSNDTVTFLAQALPGYRTLHALGQANFLLAAATFGVALLGFFYGCAELRSAPKNLSTDPDLAAFAAAVRSAVNTRATGDVGLVLPESGDGALDVTPLTTDSLPHDEILLQMSRLYRYEADVLEAQARGDFDRTEDLIQRAIEELALLIRQPGITEQPRFRELFRTLVTEYEAHFGVPADTLVLPHGDIFDLQAEMFAELNEVEEPLLEDVSAAGVLSASTTVPMTSNRLVKSSIDYLVRTRGKHLDRWLSRSETYFGMIETVLAEEKLPDELKYLAMIESGLNPRAKSWAQAVGMWQFMAGTAGDYDLKINSWVDERMDPEKSTRAAARYLKNLHTSFQDWHLALAAYNCGPTRVQRAIALHRSKSAEPVTFWSIYRYLPRETRNYVPTYIAASIVASNPRGYGISRIPSGPVYAYDTVTLRGAHMLADIARLAGTDVATIRALNPELRRSSTPPVSSGYPLRIP
ncbi:MAG: lytic transglycosylase domain-containing protein, partial [Rhodothermales bacterium]